MGGALSLAFPTRVPASAGVDKLAGVLSSSPLIRQAKAVKAPALLVRAGSVLGMLSSKLQMKAEVKPEVGRPAEWAQTKRQRLEADCHRHPCRTPAATRPFRAPTPTTRCALSAARSRVSQTCSSV